MPKRICSVDGCQTASRARGWCIKHYDRWRAHGTTDLVRPHRVPGDTRIRFWAKVTKTEYCWNWNTVTASSDYGKIRHDGKDVKVHRLSYEWAKGTIPEGMDVDHVCHNKACVNPDHLRLVTNKQNHENRKGAQSNSKSGIRGVVWLKRDQSWLSIVVHEGKRYSGGQYKNIKHAEAAAIALRNRLFTHNDADRAA